MEEAKTTVEETSNDLNKIILRPYESLVYRLR